MGKRSRLNGDRMHLVVIGLSITSSWGNGHATTYRSLLREFSRRGHRVTFLERDVPWYASNRDLPEPGFCRLGLYDDLDELRVRFGDTIAGADAVMIGSFVPEGVAAAELSLRLASGPVAFYDIDTPVTLEKLRRQDDEYLVPELIPRFDLYLSFTGGPILGVLERTYGSPAARPLYCSADTGAYFPEPADPEYDLGYMGTFSDDRQPPLDRLLLEPARSWEKGRFIVAGPQYPDHIRWPANVRRIEHLPPAEHRGFYRRQRFTLNVTREQMIRTGWSPSVRLFEAAACAVPIISDRWEGIEEFFVPDREIFLVDSPKQVLELIRELPESARIAAGERARRRVLEAHSAARRAEELEGYLRALMRGNRPGRTQEAEAMIGEEG